MERVPGRRGVDWETPKDNQFNWDHVQLEVLMDIRDELQKLNRLLHCQNFIAMPRILRTIDKRLAKRFPIRSKK